MKYFLISDLHSINPTKLIAALMDKGFENENENHKVVVAGDIIDGLGYDHGIVNLLQSYEKQNQLIAIKGNHDFGTRGVPYQHLNGPANYKEILTLEDIEGLRNLPYQLETEHFRLAHGMYIMSGSELIDKETVSVGASPVLLDTNPSDGWGVEHADVHKLKQLYKTIDDYNTALDGKPLFLGHFGIETLEMYNEDLTIDEDGFASYKDIYGLDSSVIKNGDIKVKVVEYD